MQAYTTMTTHELRVAYGMVYECLRRERRMRERVFADGNTRAGKLREIDAAIEALIVIKDFAKQHVEESPEQVALLPDAVAPKGAY